MSKFIGKKSVASVEPTTAAASSSRKLANQIPEELLQDRLLNEAISFLPANYNFEIHKIVWRTRQMKAKCVALQFPEGLLIYATTIADIIEKFSGGPETIIMGDVTYGACCVDDLTASALGADLLVHFAHSCLVPIDGCTIPVLYIFVDIGIDVEHLIATVRKNFDPRSTIAAVSTIQFVSSLHALKNALSEEFPHLIVPQSRPLSKGEILGCTAPRTNADTILYVGDGRFHLEAMMIANPDAKAFKYNPYDKTITSEEYNHEKMQDFRKECIDNFKKCRKVGLILGTLGRQGNPSIVESLVDLLQEKGIPHITVLLSEVFPAKLDLFWDVQGWIQVACPRLSIDWGRAFKKPVLTSYEAQVALKAVEWTVPYPMDYYAKEAGGQWGNYAAPRTMPKPRKGQSTHLTVEYET